MFLGFTTPQPSKDSNSVNPTQGAYIVIFKSFQVMLLPVL